MRVRKAGPDDAQALVDVFRGAVDAVPPAFIEEEQRAAWRDAWGPAEAANHLSERDVVVWVVEAEGRVVAFASLRGARLHMFYVAADRQGQGVGTLLMRHVLRAAAALGLSRVVLDANRFAAPFFRAHGFRTRTLKVVDTGGVAVPVLVMDRRDGPVP